MNGAEGVVLVQMARIQGHDATEKADSQWQARRMHVAARFPTVPTLNARWLLICDKSVVTASRGSSLPLGTFLTSLPIKYR